MPAALPPASVLGRRLRKARLAKGWTLVQLGERLFGTEDASNTVAPRISRWERGMHKPDLETIEKLAKLLDMPAAYFVAKSSLVAEAILLLSQVSPAEQRRVVDLLRDIVSESQAQQAKGKGDK